MRACYVDPEPLLPSNIPGEMYGSTLAAMRAVGVPVRYVLEVRKSGHKPNADKIVEMYAVGVQPGDLRVVPMPPATPATPRVRVKVKTPRTEVTVDPGDS